MADPQQTKRRVRPLMTTADTIKSQHPLVQYLESVGVVLKKSGKEYRTLCWVHTDTHPSMDINPTKNVYLCRSCGASGSVVDAMMHFEGLTLAGVLEKYSDGSEDITRVPPVKPTKAPAAPVDPVITAQYVYQNAVGDEVFRVIRYEPKTFRQGHWVGKKWIRNLDGVERTIYNLPNVLKSQQVWVVEGEKDADYLDEMEGIVATCNPGGAGKWLDAYSTFLKDKQVIICPDNDDPGKNHADKVRESVAPYAEWIQQLKIPDPFKDIAEYLEAGRPLKALLDVPKLYQGIELDLHSEVEREHHAREIAKLGEMGKFDLAKWLPGFGSNGILYPGDLAVVIGATGSGKSAVLQNIARAAKPLNVLYFQLELTLEQMRYREVGMATRTVALEVRRNYANGRKGKVGQHDHIYFRTNPRLTPDTLEKCIINSELKIGSKPHIIIVDYMQLMEMDGKSGSRYERFSSIAEALKRIAKATNTILIVASQAQRPSGGGETQIGLYSAKESGSIENSATLVFGVERTESSTSDAELVVVKYTRGHGGNRVYCELKPSLSIISK